MINILYQANLKQLQLVGRKLEVVWANTRRAHREAHPQVS